MRFEHMATSLNRFVFVVAILLLEASAGPGRAQTVDLAAGPAIVRMPDGKTVPMWGYTCGKATGAATCAALNPNAGAGWSPVVIAVAIPAGQSTAQLTIDLANNLSFATPGATNNIPTSLTIAGQLGGGLGSNPTFVPSPLHSAQQAGPGAAFAPPPQPNRVQSFATEVPAGSSSALVWSSLRPGTYLIESGTHPSIQAPMGLYGVLVVTAPPANGARGTAYPNVNYDAEVPLLLSEIDPVQNAAVSAAVNTAGFGETRVWSAQPGGCGNPAAPTYNTCYPPAVKYTPLYFLINGVSLDKSNTARSTFPVSFPSATGQVLVRFANAGLHMHIPMIVGATTGPRALPGITLIAEDGNPLPGAPRIQSEVFLAPGKTYDAMLNEPATAAALPVFDRQLSLSAHNHHNSGMQAYIAINGGAAPTPAAAVANPDGYIVVGSNALTVSDRSRSSIANDVNVTTEAGGTDALAQDEPGQHRSNLFVRTYFDLKGDGKSQNDEAGVAGAPVGIRFRDGSIFGFLTSDRDGYAASDRDFPRFNWYVLTSGTPRYKPTGVHVVTDAGAAADDSPDTSRIDPPWVSAEAWQESAGHDMFVEFGKKPYAVGENGGIAGDVVYASTRQYDDPRFMVQNPWDRQIPGVTVNLYREGAETLTQIDSTRTSSWDAWAQGMGILDRNCSGRAATEPFDSLLYTPQYLDAYDGESDATPYNGQFKCADETQLHPAQYDGHFEFPSVASRDPMTGKPTGTNCTGCIKNTATGTADPYYNTDMLPPGKYVVEVVVPGGYELVKEEDRNILIGDNFIAPVTQQFGALSDVFILPDQASVAGAYGSDAAVVTLGTALQTRTFWPCVGQARVAPDSVSLFPASKQAAPFAGATRNLCDRKEIVLADQTSAETQFFLFTSPNIAARSMGIAADGSSPGLNRSGSEWGVDSLDVKAVESGQMIRFSYRVVDPAKASQLNDKSAVPALIDEQAGVRLEVPVVDSVGQLRQTSAPMAGGRYWMMFSNKGGIAKPGDRVSVLIGSFRADDLVVR